MKALAVCLLALAFAQPHASPDLRPVNLSLPNQPHSLPSPNRAYTLVGDNSQLLLEDSRTHQRALVTELTLQTATVFWSPDSRFFLVNDRPASGWEDSYLYNVQTLKPTLNLRPRILVADPAAKRIVTDRNTAHAYVHAVGWLDADHLEVELNGRIDSSGTPRRIRLGHCFDLRYRVSITGAVSKLSQHEVRGDHNCGNMEYYE